MTKSHQNGHHQKLQTINATESVEKRESSHTVGWNVICYLFNILLDYICYVLFAIFPLTFMIHTIFFSFLLNVPVRF